jgi:hypothetical protein
MWGGWKSKRYPKKSTGRINRRKKTSWKTQRWMVRCNGQKKEMPVGG